MESRYDAKVVDLDQAILGLRSIIRYLDFKSQPFPLLIRDVELEPPYNLTIIIVCGLVVDPFRDNILILFMYKTYTNEILPVVLILAFAGPLEAPPLRMVPEIQEFGSRRYKKRV